MYFALARENLILSRPTKCCFVLTNGAILDGCRKYKTKMEEQLERKDEAATPKEPIKTEEVARSPETSERSDGTTSPPPNCSICLGKLINTSFTDSCLHQFCFTCLLQWSKIKTECPLCKQIFKSIIHNVRSEEDYDQYHIPRQFAPPISTSQVAASLDMNLDFGVNLNIGDGLRRFSYRTTHWGGRRMPRSLLNPEQVARQEQMPSVIPQVSREEQRRRRLNPTDYRRIVYRHGVWASPLYDVFGRSRDCSVEYYRRNPEELTRLVPWLNRELQVLLNNRAPHVAYVMRVIIDALSQYDMRSSEFRDVIRPYFNMHTDHFAHELENYARTNYDLVGYDQSVTYVPSYGLSNEYVSRIPSYTASSTSSTYSDDSDVRILDQTIDMSPLNAELPNVGPHAIAMPGPSTVGQSLHLQMPYRYPDVFTVSSDTSTSEDECEVVGFVKPRHERTPEIIELVSSDGGDLNTTSAPPEDIKISSYSSLTEENQPSTSKSKKKLKTKKSTRSRASDVFSPSTLSSDTDSSYVYFTKRKKSLKTGTRRSSKRGDDVSGRKLSETSDSTEYEKNAEHVSKRTTARVTAQRKAKHRYLSSSSESSSDSEEEWTRSSRKKKKKKKKRKSETTKKSRAAGATKTCKESSAKKRRCTADDLFSDSSSSGTVGSNRRGLDKSRTSKDTRLSSLSDSSLTADDMKQARIDDKSRVASVIVSPTNPIEKVEIVHADTVFPEEKINSESTNDVQIKKPEAKRRYPIDESDDDDDDDHDDNDDERGKNKTWKSAKKPEDRGDRNFAIKLLSRIYESRRTKRDSGSSDLEEATTRSGRPSSQCSTASEKAHASRRKSKHKDKHKEKKDKRSSRTSRSSLKSSPSASGTSGVTSSRNDVSTTSKHSDSKTSSSSKERHRSHKKRKELKHRRSRSESKSKSRRKRRRIKSASTTDFE